MGCAEDIVVIEGCFYEGIGNRSITHFPDLVKLLSLDDICEGGVSNLDADSEITCKACEIRVQSQSSPKHNPIHP